jgi:subtilisin family serine protease
MRLVQQIFKTVSLVVALSATVPAHAADLAEATAEQRSSVIEFSVRPSDTYFPLAPPPPTQGGIQWAHDLLNLPAAWDKVRGHAFVAVVDNGIQSAHPDLQGSFRPHMSYNLAAGAPGSEPYVSQAVEEGVGSSYINVPGGCMPNPIRGHGTHVAGIIAASANDQGAVGTCWHCSLMVYISSDVHKSA